MTTESETPNPEVIAIGVAKSIVADIIVSLAQHLYHLIFKHVPVSEQRSAALINVEHVANLIKDALVPPQAPVSEPVDATPDQNVAK